MYHSLSLPMPAHLVPERGPRRDMLQMSRVTLPAPLPPLSRNTEGH